jgi:hypothetical protein
MQNYIHISTVKWIVGGMSLAITSLAGFCVYLLKCLIKSKDSEAKTIRQTIPLSESLAELCRELKEIMKKLIDRALESTRDENFE